MCLEKDCYGQVVMAASEYSRGKHTTQHCVYGCVLVSTQVSLHNLKKKKKQNAPPLCRRVRVHACVYGYTQQWRTLSYSVT